MFTVNARTNILEKIYVTAKKYQNIGNKELERQKPLLNENEMNINLKRYINILINLFMNKVKEVLHELKKVFVADEEIELTEQVLETEVIEEKVELEENVEEVELADAPMDAPVEDAPEEPKVEYATKSELLELQKTIMDLLEKALQPSESKKEVPSQLSEEKVELAEEKVDEISHSPEMEVDKKVSFGPKNNRNQTIESRVFNQLFG